MPEIPAPVPINDPPPPLMPGMPVRSPRLSLAPFVLMTASAILGLNALPMEASAGLRVIAFALLGVGCFLLPCSLVAAELATGWPREGGVYLWVREALGERWGFTAIWIQWIMASIAMVVVAAFTVSSAHYAFSPELAQDKTWITAGTILLWWTVTLYNFRGLGASACLTSFAFLLGTLLPYLAIAAAGVWFYFERGASEIPLTLDRQNLLPELRSVAGLSLVAGFIFSFAGIEGTAAHAGDLQRVQRNYPLGMAIVCLIALVLTVGAAIPLAMTVPSEQLSFLGGVNQAFSRVFAALEMSWLTPVMASLVAFGGLSTLTAWCVAPATGLALTARQGTLPPRLRRINEQGVPTTLLVVQALLVTFWAGIFYLVAARIERHGHNDINAAFYILMAVNTTIYLVMYHLVYISAIRLRYTQPQVVRPFRIPGGRALGMWLVAGFGLAVVLFCFLASFIPPDYVPQQSHHLWVLFLVVCCTTITLVLPLTIYALRRPHWRDEVE